jgi:signal transduction histidine kinase
LRGFCQLAIDVLECDLSCAVVWQPAADAFVPVASAGVAEADEKALKGLRISNLQVRRALAQDATGVASAVAADPQEIFAAEVLNRLAVERCFLLPVRREAETVGLLIACYRGRARSFTAEHLQFAAGISDLAGLAVENALLSEQLDESERVMSEFVVSMSHQSRIPLNVIIGYSDLLYEGEFGGLSPEQMGIAERLRRSGRELLVAINKNLLTGSAAERQYDA